MKYLFLAVLLMSQTSLAAIYGADNRRDIKNLPTKWKQAASAVALSLPSLYLQDLDSENFIHDEHDQRHYGEEVGLCKGEKYYNQKSIGHCTAFLVHPKILVTAGHCFLPTGEVINQAHSYCENFSFWFGYNNRNQKIPFLGTMIPKKDVVRCKKVIYATNNEQIEPEDNPVDFAVFELESEVTHIEPLKLSTKLMKKGELVATIGHPHGLPAKFSGLSPLLGNHSTTLTSFMDTLSGNSGGPAFNNKAEVVGILIAGHQFDTYKTSKGCDRINKCDNNGKNCKEDTELENSNLMLKTEIWKPVIDEHLAEPNLS